MISDNDPVRGMVDVTGGLDLGYSAAEMKARESLATSRGNRSSPEAPTSNSERKSAETVV